MHRISDRLGFLGVFMVLIVFVLAAIMYIVEKRRYQSAVKEKIADRRILTNEIISAKSEYSKSLVFDYSFWNEMVEFAKKPNKEWADLNLKPALSTFHVDMAWVYSKGLELSYFEYKSEKNNLRNLNTDLVKLFSEGSFKHFFTRINNQLVEIHTAPIHPGNDTLRISTPQGFFLTGKVWDNQYIDELSRLSQTQISIIAGPQELQQTDVRSFLIPLNNEYGKPEVWLKATIESGFFTMIWQTSFHQVLITFLTGILLVIMVYFFIRIYFLKPLQVLNYALTTFNPDFLNKIRNHSHEIDTMVFSIDKLFEKNRTLENELQKKNEEQNECRKLQKIKESYLETITESIIVADETSLMIKDVNTNACRLYDYLREDFLKLRLNDIWPEANLGMFLSQQYDIEKRITVTHRKKGNARFYAQISGNFYKSEEGAFVVIAVIDITDKIETQNALQESENKLKVTLSNTLELNRRIAESESQLKDLIDNTIESIIWITPEKTIKTFNKAAEKINMDVYGIDIKEGQNIMAYIFDKDEFEINFNASMSGEKKWVEKNIYSQVAQKSFWFEFRYSPVFNSSNNIVGVLLTTIDISVRKKAELELQNHQQRLKEAEKIARMGHFEINLKNGHSVWSDETYRILDILTTVSPSYELLRNTIHESDREFIYFMLDQLIIEGKPFNHEFRIRRSNGEIRYVQSIASVAEKDKVQVVFGTIQDISERVQFEKELSESEEKYRNVVETIEEGIVVLNPELRFEFVNKATEHIFGIEKDKIIGHFLSEYLSYNQLEILKHNLLKRKKGEPITTEIEIERPDGAIRNILITTTPKYDKGLFTGTFNVFRDITDRKKAEEQLRFYNENLKDLNATKDKFFSIIAHDLKNPFNTIAGFAQLLTSNIDHYDKEKIKNFVEIIYNSSTGASALLENLLQWSLAQSGRIAVVPQTFSLNALIMGTINLIKDSASKKNIVINNQINSSLITHADKDMVSLVVRNLLSNAIKFTPEGGEILISASTNQNYHIVTINDTGIGIEPDVLKHLFQIDYSHSTSGTLGEKGSGLGLILCKEFIAKNNGDIWAESEPGKGSKFSFSLPVYTD